MSDTTFDVSTDLPLGKRGEKVDYVGELRTALRRPIEQTWLPRNPLIACDENHSLLTAIQGAFYEHLPLRLTPDVIWITLVRGFALHVQESAEVLRHRFVNHSGKQKISVQRNDFLPGEENPWPEVFDEFSDQIRERTGGMTDLVQADFSTTGPTEKAVSNLMVMDTFKSYFEYEMRAGCGIPRITLDGELDDWRRLRERARRFAEFGLEDWIAALEPILEQFERAKGGDVDVSFWKSMFRYNSGSGPAVMTGWANVLFPYFKKDNNQLFRNPYLMDWRERLEVDDRQDFRERWKSPQGVGMNAIPSCWTSVPLKVFWGERESEMRLVGGLLGVSQDDTTLEIAPECGWVVIYEEPIDPLSPHYEWLENRKQANERE